MLFLMLIIMLSSFIFTGISAVSLTLSFNRMKKYMPTLRINYFVHVTVECILLSLSKTCSIYLDNADAVVAAVVLSRYLFLKEIVLVLLEYIQESSLCEKRRFPLGCPPPNGGKA